MNNNILQAVDREQYDEALRLRDREPSLTVQGWLLKGRCILLGESTKYTFNDAKVAFENVLEGDPENIEANLELGYYYFSVDENEEKAKRYFERSFFLAKKYYVESVIANIKYLAESNPRQGVEFMEKALHLDDFGIDVLKKELTK